MGFFKILSDSASEALKVADSVAKNASKVAEDVAKSASKVAEEVLKNASVVTEDVAKSASEVISDVADNASKKYDEISKYVSESAQSVSKAIDENENIQLIKQSAADIAQKAGDAISNKAMEWRRDFVGFLEIKLKSMLKDLDFQTTISDIEKTGKEHNIDVAPLVNFVYNLKTLLIIKDVKQDIICPIAQFLENDLDSVLEIAILVARFAPVPAIVVTSIELFIKHRKKIVMVAGLANKCLNMDDDSNSSENDSSERQSTQQESLKQDFLDYLEVAKSDGVVTAEEREFLFSLGTKAGYRKSRIEEMLEFN